MPVPAGRRARDPKRALRIVGARANNLRNLTVEIPLGLFVAVTGVSGSGKSTLVTDLLYAALARHFYRARMVPGAHDRIEGLPHIDKVIEIDRADRANAALQYRTTRAIPPIASSRAAPRGQDARLWPVRRFVQRQGGRCEAAKATIGNRSRCTFCRRSSRVKYAKARQRDTRKALQRRSVATSRHAGCDALDGLQREKADHDKLELLNDVGLGYPPLGQSPTTLSGGEAQRVKPRTDWPKRDTGPPHIRDEPTPGAFEDVRVHSKCPPLGHKGTGRSSSTNSRSDGRW